jgi:hypothetical protein
MTPHPNGTHAPATRVALGGHVKVYLAARYGRRAELCAYRDQLEAVGHRVTARWLSGLHESDNGRDPLNLTDSARFAQEDMDDLSSAEVVIAFTEPPTTTYSRGGRHVEAGMALAWGKRLLIVGPAENVFYGLPCVERYDTPEDAIAAVGIYHYAPCGTPPCQHLDTMHGPSGCRVAGCVCTGWVAEASAAQWQDRPAQALPGEEAR